MTTPSTPRLPRVPINLITGFLGTGKTTALLTLLAQKPADQVWAVIVNEFGEVGIDGAVLEGAGAEIREIAGGCLCCATGPQLPITLAKVIREKRPQRVLIEASGLAHASRVVDMLRRPPLAEALDIQATLGRAPPNRVPAYLPLSIDHDTRNWLTQALRRGHADGAQLLQCGNDPVAHLRTPSPPLMIASAIIDI